MNALKELRNGTESASKTASRFASTSVRRLYTRVSVKVHRHYEDVRQKADFSTEARVGDSDPLPRIRVDLIGYGRIIPD